LAGIRAQSPRLFFEMGWLTKKTMSRDIVMPDPQAMRTVPENVIFENSFVCFVRGILNLLSGNRVNLTKFTRALANVSVELQHKKGYMDMRDIQFFWTMKNITNSNPQELKHQRQWEQVAIRTKTSLIKIEIGSYFKTPQAVSLSIDASWYSNLRFTLDDWSQIRQAAFAKFRALENANKRHVLPKVLSASSSPNTSKERKVHFA
jgi:hypothetical protein